MTVLPKNAYVVILYLWWRTLRFRKSILQLLLLLFVLLVRLDFLRERLLAKLPQCRMTLCGQDGPLFSDVPGGDAVFTLVGVIFIVKEKDETIISPFVNQKGLMGQGTPAKKQGCCFPFRPANSYAFTAEDAETTPHDIISAYMN